MCVLFFKEKLWNYYLSSKIESCLEAACEKIVNSYSISYLLAK